MMAVCGLDCETCDIRLVAADPDAAQRVVAWFREMGWLEEDEGAQEIIEREIVCKGCREDRSLHWSPECPLRVSCAERRRRRCRSRC